MATALESANSLSTSCKICEGVSVFFGETTVLKKYRVHYFSCQECGFIQTEKPYWLEEAYSSAIASQDVGVMQRNLVNRELTSAVLNLLFPKMSNAVDFGAGHGIFVRLMRDRGFNFFWSDLHATNDYARGFELQEHATYDFLTAFEVLEHLVEPIPDLARLMDLSDNVFVSTCIVPQPRPGLSDWWYYVPSTGQHISFYTTESLRRIAARFGRRLLTCGSYHLFTREKRSDLLYKVANKLRIARIVNQLHRRASLMENDFEKMTS